jgi:hypothetical protein
MSEDFRPSTRQLLQLVGWDKQHRPNPAHWLYTIAQQENNELHDVAIHIGNRIFSEVDRHRYDDGTWPIDSATIDALRAALADHRTGYAGYELAYLLLRAGIEDPEVMERLHPWDRLIFRWRDDGLKAADVGAMLRAAGASAGLDPDELVMIDGWIAQPITALNDWHPLLDALFGIGQRVVLANIKDSAQAQHDKLLRELLAQAIPSVPVDEVSQNGISEWVDWIDPNGELIKNARHEEWVTVKFSHAGRPHEFRFEGNGPSLNIAAVVKEVDLLLADLGRQDRVFQFMQQRSYVPVHMFLVADATRFGMAAERLGLPLTTPS